MISWSKRPKTRRCNWGATHYPLNGVDCGSWRSRSTNDRADTLGSMSAWSDYVPCKRGISSPKIVWPTPSFRDCVEPWKGSWIVTRSRTQTDSTFCWPDRLRSASNAFFVTGREWRQCGLRANALLDNLQKMLNTNENFELDNLFQLNVVQVRPPPRRSGPKKTKKSTHVPGHLSNVRLRKVKRSLIKICQNTEGWCAAQAIVTSRGLHLAGHDPHARKRWTCDCRNLHRRQWGAERLMTEVGLGPGAWGPDKLNQVATAPSLCDYKLVVLDTARNYVPMVYGRGPHILGLLYNDHHYDVLTKVSGFLRKKFFCPVCFKGYDNRGRHRCPGNKAVHCNSCNQNTCDEYREAFKQYRSPKIECPDCRRTFYGPGCLEKHKAYSLEGEAVSPQHRPVCETRQKCATCRVYLAEPKDIRHHRCNHAKCPSCKEYVNIDTHRCFIQVASLEEQDPDQVPPIHVFFNIKAKQGATKHVPNLLVCQHSDEDTFHHWRDEDCVLDFLKQLETWCQGGKQSLTVTAHNFEGYDWYPIIKKLHVLCSKMKQIRNGGKVLQLTCLKNYSVQFIDSMSFFSMKLAKFPKTFELTELKNGYFPHLFNTNDNQDYVGPLLAVHYYMPDNMSMEDRAQFLEWHAQLTHEEYIFNFKKELLEYCQSDVRLLKEGCMNFKREFEAEAGFDPFEQMTIASACNHYLRTHCLDPMTPYNTRHPTRPYNTRITGPKSDPSRDITTPWTVLTPMPTPCTNSTGAPRAFPKGTNPIPNTWGRQWTTCSRPRKKNFACSANTGTW